MEVNTMTHKKLRKIAALTGALLAVNAGVGAFAPCYAENDFAAYAAESTEVAMEQYKIRITMETEEARTFYKMGEKLSFEGFYVSGYHYAYDENRNLIDETRFENESLQKLVDDGTVTVDTGDFYTDQCAGNHCITINYGTESTEIWVSVENEK